MKQILSNLKCGNVRKDLGTDKIYFQTNLLKDNSLLISNFNAIECTLNSEFRLQVIYNKRVVSWDGNGNCKIYDFSAGKLSLIKETVISNATFNNDLSRFYYEKTNPIDFSDSIVCYDSNNYNILFEVSVEKSLITLFCFEHKLILANRPGTKLFFYENDKLLFTKDIPLYFKMTVDIHNPDRSSQTFKLITKYEQQLICAVNDDRVISIDINTSDILWELTDKEVQGSSGNEQVFDGLFFRSTVLGNIIHVLCHTSYMQINIVTRVAKIIKDLNENNLNIKDIVCYCPTLYKNKFYFLFQRDNGRYHVVNEFGIFNTDTCELEQTIKVALPNGHSLMSNPIVDEKFIYIKDNENCLYIFSEEAVDEAELAIFKTIENTKTIENIIEEKEEQIPQETTAEELDIFDGIISTSSYFIDVPDCITQSSDYKSTIEDSFKLTGSLLVLDSYNSKEVNNTFILNITVNAVEEIFTIPFTSKYVEGAALVTQMNILLNKYGNNTTKKFVELTGGDVDFGIAFITEAERLALLEEGYIWEE